MLELSHLCKSYLQSDSSVTVLRDASLSLNSGYSAALLGESGCGKSTLLHLIAGLDRPDKGEINFQNETWTKFNEKQWNQVRRSQLSLIFQQFHLIPTLSVIDNLELQARLCQRLDMDFRDHLITELGLSDLLKRLPQQLSGGQQQRVAIGRALLHQPALILADEPTGNLDEKNSEIVIQLLVSLVKDAGSSLLMVTHSSSMAAHLDEQWYLRHGQLEPV